MATLAQLRARLNAEVGVASDGDTVPWTTTVRNQAISDGYAELWRKGVWKPLEETDATVADTWSYALTAIRRLKRVELLDESSNIVDQPRAKIEDDGTGGYRLRLISPVAAGYTLRTIGWGVYKFTFSGDSDPDDLPAEHVRVPLLKAKAILYRQQLATYARFGQRQVATPEMNVSVDQLMAIVAAAEREFEEEARAVAALRPRAGLTPRR